MDAGRLQFALVFRLCRRVFRLFGCAPTRARQRQRQRTDAQLATRAGLQLLYFRRTDNELEFILMALLSCVYGYFITRFQWLWRLVARKNEQTNARTHERTIVCMLFVDCCLLSAVELYSFALFFFLLGLYHQPSKYLPLLTGVLGSITMTFFVFFVYPYLFRCFLGGTGAIVTRVLGTDNDTRTPRYEIEVRNWFSSQSGVCVCVCAFVLFVLVN